MSPSNPDDAGSWAELWRGEHLAQFSLLILGVWLNAADQLVTVTVMPSVARDIGGYAYFGWTTAIFLVGAITAGAGAGAFALRSGLRRSMVAAGAAYVVGCALSALAPNIWAFLAARLLQGLGAGGIIGLAFVAVGAVFPPRLWSRAFAAVTSVWGVATLVGPLTGGAFAEAGFWRGSFWLFAAQGLVFCAAAARLLPNQAPPEIGGRPPWRQLAMVSLGVAAIGWAGFAGAVATALLLGAVGAGLLASMVVFDARCPHPMLPRATRDLSSIAGAGYLTIFLLQAASIGWSVYGAAFVQVVYGQGPLIAGYVVSLEALGWTLAALPVARIDDSRDGAFIRLGPVIVLAGLLGLGLAIGHGPLAVIGAASALLGAGFGLFWSFLNRRILASLPDRERALGSSAIPTIQMIGNAVGAAAAGTLGDQLGLGAGIGRAAALRHGPVMFFAFLPLAVGGAIAANRVVGIRKAEAARAPRSI